ncbi:hypothetical protein DFH08DRAFT_809156 [Mycena albidolilacea]|uniref:Uncharacterized protein n=1 Tax=Mycena albidolilacea TaxID=1033008 RepID=A0AAD7EQZ2_9AGAR|nr:hypothetical protein DFH08DRAFT_809156 [Mycena albidolilacea]
MSILSELLSSDKNRHSLQFTRLGVSCRIDTITDNAGLPFQLPEPRYTHFGCDCKGIGNQNAKVHVLLAHAIALPRHILRPTRQGASAQLGGPKHLSTASPININLQYCSARSADIITTDSVATPWLSVPHGSAARQAVPREGLNAAYIAISHHSPQMPWAFRINQEEVDEDYEYDFICWFQGFQSWDWDADTVLAKSRSWWIEKGLADLIYHTEAEIDRSCTKRQVPRNALEKSGQGPGSHNWDGQNFIFRQVHWVSITASKEHFDQGKKTGSNFNVDKCR